ncbi:MAG TPA: hypothetical protein VHE35_06445 [Kofleriaceae bacterium]|nr:hypothetical protein [Kofleriaceae bacterium]
MLITLALAGTAAAQPSTATPPANVCDDPAPGAPRPWADGVPPDEQKAALQLFTEGNENLKDSLFPKAAESYREALKHWDHPAIHYNLALALVNLDQPLQLYDELKQAMKYGSAPIDKDKCERAQNLLTLTVKQLAHVEYTVKVPGAVLVFDGKEEFTGPGTWKKLVTAGEHAVLVRADGYVTSQFQAKILGGETDKRDIQMFTENQLLREKRLMPAWVPYTVGAVGVAVGAGAFFLQQNAKNTFADYDAGVKTCAATDSTGGCTMPPAGLFDMKSSAENKQKIAIGGYIFGGVALTAGVTLFVLNRPTLVRIKPKETSDESTSFNLTPIVSSHLTGIAASGHF